MFPNLQHHPRAAERWPQRSGVPSLARFGGARRLGTICAALLALISLIVGMPRSWADAAEIKGTVKDTELKAAYLYNFGIFTQWPKEKIGTNSNPFVIGVIGNGDVAAELEKFVAQAKKIGGRELVVRRLRPSADLSECSIVFIGGDIEPGPILASLKADGKRSSGILTVGETERFIERGGMINFVLVRDNLKYEVNRGVAEEAGLQVNTQILKAALKIIGPERGRP